MWKPSVRQLVDAARPKPAPIDALAELYEELLSARGPFWLPAGERMSMLPADERSRLASMSRELDLLKKSCPATFPQRRVVVQDGGPKERATRDSRTPRSSAR